MLQLSACKEPLMNAATRPYHRGFARYYAVLLLATVSAGAAAQARPLRTSPSIFEGTVGDGASGLEISTAELQAAIAGEPPVLVLDARPYAEYAVSHIPGARAVAGRPGLPASQYAAS